MTPAVERVAATLRAAGKRPARTSSGYSAHCPAHDDANPSLSIWEGKTGWAKVKCHKGCQEAAILSALGLQTKDLAPDTPHHTRYEAPRSPKAPAPMPTPRPAQSLAQFCAERHLSQERLSGRWRVAETAHKGRPCLQYPTALEVDRVKYLDGEKPKYCWAGQGGSAHWYGMGAAVKAGGPVLYIVNGEPSVWACDAEGVPAVCAFGESKRFDEKLLSELKGSGFSRFAVVYDLDDAGRKGGLAVADALRAAGLDAVALKLPDTLGEGGDVDDLHRRVGAGLADALAALPVLGEDAPPIPGVLLSEVVARPVPWLWREYVPLGGLTIIDGNPGQGKTTMILDLAARITRGDNAPDGSPLPKGGVVICTAEDSLEYTILPRMLAVGADTTKVRAIRVMKDGEGLERGLTIPEDIDAIRSAVANVGAVLVVVDPLMAHLSGRHDSHKDQDIRQALGPLHLMAEELGVGVVILRHLNKASGGSAITRGAGSMGIIGAARASFVVGPSPDNPDLKVLAPNKCNLARKTPSLSFAIESVPVEGAGSTARVRWAGATETTADDLTRPQRLEADDEQDEVTGWLEDFLAGYGRPSRDVWAESKRRHYTEYAVKKAKKKLSVSQEKEGFGGQERWVLPNAADNNNFTRIGNSIEDKGFAGNTSPNAGDSEMVARNGADSTAMETFAL